MVCARPNNTAGGRLNADGRVSDPSAKQDRHTLRGHIGTGTGLQKKHLSEMRLSMAVCPLIAPPKNQTGSEQSGETSEVPLC